MNGLPENKTSFYHLEVCCRYVAERFGHATFADWTNSDYIRLSSLLSNKTGTQISPNTLKRIFGKLKTPERYYPQKATRDALARFAGFEDWEIFQQQHPQPALPEGAALPAVAVEIPVAVTSAPVIPVAGQAGKRRFLHQLVAGVLLLVLMLLALWWWWPVQRSIPIVLPGDAELICNNPEGENPHSAIFKLALTDRFKGDPYGFFVWFGDRHTGRPIKPGVLLTHYYEMPGRYYAQLWYQGQCIDTSFVNLRSNGWTATANVERDTTRVFPINTTSLFKNNSMTVDARQVFEAGADTSKTFFVSFANMQPTTINGDHFELATHVTTSIPRAGVRCSAINIDLYGERSKHSLVIMKPGCTSFVNLLFSEQHTRGESEDLSALGADLTVGGTIKLQVINKHVGIFINNKQVFETTYQKPLGKIYGINLQFSGIGKVDSLQLKDLRTGEVFKKNQLSFP